MTGVLGYLHSCGPLPFLALCLWSVLKVSLILCLKKKKCVWGSVESDLECEDHLQERCQVLLVTSCPSHCITPHMGSNAPSHFHRLLHTCDALKLSQRYIHTHRNIKGLSRDVAQGWNPCLAWAKPWVLFPGSGMEGGREKGRREGG